MTDTKALLQGYKAFYDKYFVQDTGLYEKLHAKGQAPKTLVIACSDSRVDPAILMNANPGDIFTVRNVANLVPLYEPTETGHHGVSAALEFAVKSLKVKNIIVLGHSECGGIAHLLKTHGQMDDTEFVSSWVDMASAVCQGCKNMDPDQAHVYAEKNSILISLENLLQFPWIASAVQEKKLMLHGWYFNIQTGALLTYDKGKDRFERV